MEPRTIVRFGKGAILLHWLHAVPFAVLLTTGALMFFGLVDFDAGPAVRTAHKAAALLFVLGPVAYFPADPAGTGRFFRNAFRWERSDLAWLKAAPAYYFGRRTEMPLQGYLNGDQKLWQLVVVVTGAVSTLSGVLMWFFRMKMPPLFYQWVLVAHGAAFLAAAAMFPVHLYLNTLHPKMGEALASMVDGKVSSSYAKERFGKWSDPMSREKNRVPDPEAGGRPG